MPRGPCGFRWKVLAVRSAPGQTLRPASCDRHTLHSVAHDGQAHQRRTRIGPAQPLRGGAAQRGTGRPQQLVADSNQSPTATSTPEQPVAHSDLTSRSQRHHPSPTATLIFQESIKNHPHRRARPKRPDTEAPKFHTEIIEAYHTICPELPKIKGWTQQRREALDARIAERKSDGKPADEVTYWRGFFEQVAASDYLCGKVNGFRASLGWLIQPNNFLKTIEGNYDNRQSITEARAHG